MGNNPIRYSDPLGDTIQVRFGGFLGIGRKTVNVNENGAITNTDGTEYTGKVKGFLKKVSGAISDLSSGSSSANGWLKELSNSDNIFTIKRGNGKNEFVPDNEANAYAWQGKGMINGIDNTGNGGSGGTIFWSPNSGGNVVTTNGLDNNSTTNLAHELLGHGLDANRGERRSLLDQGLSLNEWQAVYRENIIRSQMKLNLRTHYVRDGSTGIGPYLLDSTTNSVLSPTQPAGFKPIIGNDWYHPYGNR